MEIKDRLTGSIVALVTPMLDTGAIDYDSLATLIEYHIEHKTHGIVAVGTSGESATLTVEEHLNVIKFVVEVANKRLPIIAGTGANSTQEAIYLTQQAHALGADASLLVVPYYNKPNQEGLYLHFKAIAEASPVAQIVYNVPGRTVADLSNDTMARLAEIDNIVACKDATGDVARGAELVQLCGDQINILSGDDATALELMKVGGKGDISVTANVAPAQMSEMCQAALQGDFERAQAIDEKLQALHQQLFVESNPIPVKYAVYKQGYMASNYLRLPLTKLAKQYEPLVESAIDLAFKN